MEKLQHIQQHLELISQDEKELLKKKLTSYHKSMLAKLITVAANTELKTLTRISFVIGFQKFKLNKF